MSESYRDPKSHCQMRQHRHLGYNKSFRRYRFRNRMVAACCAGRKDSAQRRHHLLCRSRRHNRTLVLIPVDSAPACLDREVQIFLTTTPIFFDWHHSQNVPVEGSILSTLKVKPLSVLTLLEVVYLRSALNSCPSVLRSESHFRTK